MRLLQHFGDASSLEQENSFNERKRSKEIKALDWAILPCPSGTWNGERPESLVARSRSALCSGVSSERRIFGKKETAALLRDAATKRGLSSRGTTTIARIGQMAVYGLTIFIGAFLLFQVQPVIGKYILPWFGGAPSVWTICMLFFQAVLLVGYAYAHQLPTRFKLRRQGLIHLGLALVALAFVPAIPSEVWKPSGAGNPSWRIIELLAATIGLPYLVLSATSPLLQHWFRQTNPQASPYRLYALSNVGSLLALATYPTLFETHFTRQSQAKVFAALLVLYAVGVAVCVYKLWRETPEHDGSPIAAAAAEPRSVPGQSARETAVGGAASGDRSRSGAFDATVAYWILLPACASALLLATTNKICQEVAVVPFLWVVPLGLYLLSFIICFDNPRWYKRWPFGISLAIVLGAVCWALFHWATIAVPSQMAIYGAACFVCCMVCHGELYRLRPEPERLTRFYLMIALGGVLGGVFVGIIAPLLFNDYYELQLGLALCGLLFLLRLKGSLDDAGGARAVPGRSGAGAHFAGAATGQRATSGQKAPAAKTRSWASPVFSGLAVAWVALVVAFTLQARQYRGSKTRNFYGVLTTYEREDPGSRLHFAKLVHGRTTHGLQFREEPRANWPTMYFTERSGVALALQQLPAGSRRVAVVGLGVGTLASYGQQGDLFRFYEINPTVAQLARTRFSYLANCRAQTEIVLGDARLSLEREPPQGFDLLVLDAFTSDAIPVHLLTEEAFRIYERHLKSSGILAVHVSNLSLDLEPVVANAAARLGYTATMVDYRPPPQKWWVARSKWILLSKGDTALRVSSCCQDARPARTDLARVPLWTDDFTSLFQILWRPSAREIFPSTAERELKAALELAAHGSIGDAIKHYRRVLQNEPDLLTALNNLAWILATNPDPALRNGAEAVQCARRACDLTNFKTTIPVGTLAAAYAEAGQFTQAITTAEQACALASAAGDTALLQRNQQLLELYRAGKPVRE